MRRSSKEHLYAPAWYYHNAKVRELVHVIAMDNKGTAWVRWASDQRTNEVDAKRIEMIEENR